MERENSVATTTHVPVEQATCSTALCSFPLFMTRPRLCCSLKKNKKKTKRKYRESK